MVGSGRGSAASRRRRRLRIALRRDDGRTLAGIDLRPAVGRTGIAQVAATSPARSVGHRKIGTGTRGREGVAPGRTGRRSADLPAPAPGWATCGREVRSNGAILAAASADGRSPLAARRRLRHAVDTIRRRHDGRAPTTGVRPRGVLLRCATRSPSPMRSTPNGRETWWGRGSTDVHACRLQAGRGFISFAPAARLAAGRAAPVRRHRTRRSPSERLGDIVERAAALEGRAARLRSSVRGGASGLLEHHGYSVHQTALGARPARVLGPAASSSVRSRCDADGAVPRWYKQPGPELLGSRTTARHRRPRGRSTDRRGSGAGPWHSAKAWLSLKHRPSGAAEGPIRTAGGAQRSPAARF